jgi:enoyl-CoA hydratase/carnithine racemase
MPLVQGLGFPGGETMIEPWLLMNWKRAYEYLYTAQTVSADEALRLGMVNRVVPADELEETTEQLARDIAKAPLSTLMATKQLVGRAWELMGMRMHWRMSNDLMTVTGHTTDAMALRQQLMERGQRPRDLTGG